MSNVFPLKKSVNERKELYFPQQQQQLYVYVFFPKQKLNVFPRLLLLLNCIQAFIFMLLWFTFSSENLYPPLITLQTA